LTPDSCDVRVEARKREILAHRESGGFKELSEPASRIVKRGEIRLLYIAIISIAITVGLIGIGVYIRQPIGNYTGMTPPGGTTVLLNDEEALVVLKKLVTPVQQPDGRWMAYSALEPEYKELEGKIIRRHLYANLSWLIAFFTGLYGIVCLWRYFIPQNQHRLRIQ
jgi:hypothetical protein